MPIAGRVATWIPPDRKTIECKYGTDRIHHISEQQARIFRKRAYITASKMLARDIGKTAHGDAISSDVVANYCALRRLHIAMKADVAKIKKDHEERAVELANTTRMNIANARSIVASQCAADYDNLIKRNIAFLEVIDDQARVKVARAIAADDWDSVSTMANILGKGSERVTNMMNTMAKTLQDLDPHGRLSLTVNQTFEATGDPSADFQQFLDVPGEEVGGTSGD